MTAAVPPAGPAVAAEAHWSEASDGPPPRIAGFVVSAFSPLVAAVADRCLAAAHGSRTAGDPRRLARTGLVLASAGGDRDTAQAVARAIADGVRVPPLLFFQSNPNAVAGHIAARWGLRGPIGCLRTAAAGDALADACAAADLLLLAGEADEVLAVAAEAGAGTPGEARARLLVPPPPGGAAHPTAQPKGHPYP